MPAGDERGVFLLVFFLYTFLGGNTRRRERTYVTATAGYDDASMSGFLNDRRRLEVRRAVISRV